jgi:hypothetical protein
VCLLGILRNLAETDGTLYDSTRDVEDHRAPFTFTLGSNRVTAGMNEAVAGMHIGGRRIAIVPPKLGYGRLKIGAVPSNSTLIYDLELLEVRGLAPLPPSFLVRYNCVMFRYVCVMYALCMRYVCVMSALHLRYICVTFALHFLRHVLLT